MAALLDRALAAIREKRADIESRFGIRLIGVVGSVARGEEKLESDVDIIFDVAGRPTLFDLADASFVLEEILGRGIDLVNREALRPNARAWLERDLVVA